MAKTSAEVRKGEPDIQKSISKTKDDIKEEKRKRGSVPTDNTPTPTEKKLRTIMEKFRNSEISLLETKKSYEELTDIINNSDSLSPEEAKLGIEIVRKVGVRIVFFYVE